MKPVATMATPELVQCEKFRQTLRSLERLDGVTSPDEKVSLDYKETRMNRWMTIRTGLIAGVFFMFGFLVADRMTTVKAEPVPTAQEFQGGSFSGTDGAFVAKSGSGSSIFIIRGNKIWKLDPNQSQSPNNKVWGVIE